ncbi:MAG TPA: DNA recombination protein RmuC [Candidatus Limiplasma sp.]|nr:DNA recombination protein RmuC [Candidatus Limiplasma sp.]HPS80931.1 DNA recombination protein RmuC [Candidatus Limiplasma sp.]
MFETMEPWQWIVLGALGLIVLLLLWVLAAITRRNRNEAHHLRDVQDELEEGFHALQASLNQQSLSQREEQLRTLQGIGDSLAGLMNRGAEQQSNFLAVWRQNTYEHDRTLESQQASLHRLTEDSLGKFEGRMQNVDATLNMKLTQNEARMERLRETLEKSLGELRVENTQKLDEMRHTVDEKLQDTLDRRLAQSFSQVSERLEQVYQSLGEVHRLAEGVGDLKRVLGNVKKRGVWGEIQLGGLLEEALTSTQYAVNVQVRPHTDERVEYAVCLPGKDGERPVYLPIDSKFPQEDYTRLVEASDLGDVAQTEAARKALANAVRVEAKRIAGKYVEPPYTTDFAIMFLPLESLYAEVVRNAELVEQLQRELRVVVAGPSTLLAMLNSLQMGFKTLAIEKRSAELWRLLGAVKTDFGNFSQVLQKTQEKLRQATDTIDTAFVRTRSIERKLRRVEALDEDEAKKLLDEPGAVLDDLADEPDEPGE